VRSLGKGLMITSIFVFAVGLVMYFGLSKPSESEQLILEADRSVAGLCEATKMLDRYDGNYTDCSESVARLEMRETELADRAETFTLPGLASMMAGPFLFLVGLILFVGQKPQTATPDS